MRCVDPEYKGEIEPVQTLLHSTTVHSALEAIQRLRYVKLLQEVGQNKLNLSKGRNQKSRKNSILNSFKIEGEGVSAKLSIYLKQI